MSILSFPGSGDYIFLYIHPGHLSYYISVTGHTYLGFVVDDTGSMSVEITAVKQWIQDCVDGVSDNCGVEPTGGWLTVSFNDPCKLDFVLLFKTSQRDNCENLCCILVQSEFRRERDWCGFLLSVATYPILNCCRY